MRICIDNDNNFNLYLFEWRKKQCRNAMDRGIQQMINATHKHTSRFQTNVMKHIYSPQYHISVICCIIYVSNTRC
jgi:hypothetical protein